MNFKLFFLSLGTVLLGSFLAFYVNGFPTDGIDDANIYMVYMRNFSEGHGFVYNVGGERVEGFTSLFWTILGAGIYHFTDSIGPVLMLINIVVITYSIYKYLLFIQENQAYGSKLTVPFQVLFASLIVVIPGFFSWTVIALLETGIWCSVLSLLLLFVLKNTGRSKISDEIYFCSLIVILILIRPESLLWGLFFVSARGFKVAYDTRNIRASFYQMLPGIIIYIITISILITWRISYFGFPLPNTFYAKVSGDKLHNLLYGGFYLYKNFLHNPLLLLTALLVLINIKAISKSYLLIILTGFFGVTLFIPLYTGGDHFGMGRFIQPSLLGVYLLLVLLIFQKRQLSLKEVSALVLFLSFTSQNSWYESILFRSGPISHEFALAQSGRSKSERLNKFFSYEDDGYPEIGVLTAGGSAYAYLGKTNDLLGLNNSEMAHFEEVGVSSNGPKNHSGFKQEVFFKQEPDIFFLSLEILENDDPRLYEPLTIGEFSREVFKSIDSNPEFENEFDAVVISNLHLDYSIKTFASEDFLATLDVEDYSYKKISYK